MSDKENRPEEKRKRNWWERPLITFWVILEMILLQSTIASYQELEPRAAAIFGGMFITLLISGIIIWIIHKNQLL